MAQNEVGKRTRKERNWKRGKEQDTRLLGPLRPALLRLGYPASAEPVASPACLSGILDTGAAHIADSALLRAAADACFVFWLCVAVLVCKLLVVVCMCVVLRVVRAVVCCSVALVSTHS